MTTVYETDDHRAIRDQTKRFVEAEVKPHGDTWEEQGFVPRDVLRKMGDIGFFGLRVPEEHGGIGMGALTSVVFAEELGRSTYGGFSATVLVHSDMASPHLFHSGSEEQITRWSEGILSGETLTAIAVTEPGAGSDVAGIRTTARREGDGFVVNGSKTFITNGVHGDLFFVAAKTDSSAGSRGISLFLIPKETKGFSVSRALRKFGWNSSDTAELAFEDCWVGGESMLGEENEGFYSIMRNFQNERVVLAATAIGEAQAAIELTLDYTKKRQAFGAPLYEKQAVRHRLAMLQARIQGARQLVYWAGWAMEEGSDPTREVSMAKAVAGELVNEVMYACQQLFGGAGYMRESVIERMVRDARIHSIGGGTTEIMLEEIAKRS
ncbi:MAG: acyl-CoA dehydrogenase family protein [Acidimicrobiia bacterium]